MDPYHKRSCRRKEWTPTIRVAVGGRNGPAAAAAVVVIRMLAVAAENAGRSEEKGARRKERGARSEEQGEIETSQEPGAIERSKDHALLLTGEQHWSGRGGKAARSSDGVTKGLISHITANGLGRRCV